MSKTHTGGKFIVIEGGDGAGKDTQVDLLKRDFGNRKDIVFTRDPGGTPTALKIRELVLAQFNEPIEFRAELLLFLASRAQLVDALVAPVLHEGKHVICMRFDLSTIAYQLYGRGQRQFLERFQEIAAFSRGTTTPDHYVLLDVDPSIGLERTTQAKGASRDRFEKEQLDFHQRVQEGFQTHISDFPHTIIDGNQNIDDVHRELLACIKEQLGA